jgi:hypothetical protein
VDLRAKGRRVTGWRIGFAGDGEEAVSVPRPVDDVPRRRWAEQPSELPNGLMESVVLSPSELLLELPFGNDDPHSDRQILQ